MAFLPPILFPPWAPDLSPIVGVAQVVSGCVPMRGGWSPFKVAQSFSDALGERCRGMKFARMADGSVKIFAASATRLYLLDNTDNSWDDVSKGGAAYPDLVTTDNWQIEQYNDLVIAVQQNTAPQVFDLSSSTEFADLGGSPPFASHIAIINRFIVLTGLLSEPRRVQWCDLDAPTTWTAGVGLADFEDLPDGGSCLSVAGGDAFGVVFQDESWRTLTYMPGSPLVFAINRVSKTDPMYARYSAITAGGRVFFCGAQGFKMIQPGGPSEPIGKDQVDETFFKDVDSSQLRLVIGSPDPTSTRVYWAYKSIAGNDELFDKILCYDWSLKRWGFIPQSGEYLAPLQKSGLTLEQLDAIAPTPLPITGAADNGAGLIRLELAGGLSNADFDIVGQNFIVVQGVVGTVEANGNWAFTVIDSTHIDLVGSAFANAYVSGGAIGGALDALPFSLDSLSTASLAALGICDENHKIGFFSGDNREAIIETAEQNANGQTLFVSGGRPITDAAGAMMSVGGRMTAQAAVSYSPEKTIDANTGFAPALVETRYPRLRLRIPEGEQWTFANGIEPEMGMAGDR